MAIRGPVVGVAQGMLFIYSSPGKKYRYSALIRGLGEHDIVRTENLARTLEFPLLVRSVEFCLNLGAERESFRCIFSS